MGAVARHVAHLAVPARRQPVLEVALVGSELDVRYTDAGKAQFTRPECESGANVCWIGRSRISHLLESMASIMSR